MTPAETLWQETKETYSRTDLLSLTNIRDTGAEDV